MFGVLCFKLASLKLALICLSVQRFRGAQFWDVRGSHQLLVSSHLRER